MVIYGLTDYLAASGELHPNFNAAVTVNGRALLTRHFGDAEALAPSPVVVNLPDDALAPGNDIRITRSGDGRLYWSARIIYYSTAPTAMRAGSATLNLLRDYYKLTPAKEGDKIVYRLDPLEGAVQPGDILAVRQTVTGSAWRYLLLEDPIPAGAEFIERDDLYEIKEKPAWWTYWFTRRELHDDRVAIFQTWFPAGQKQYFYLLKIVNPGLFRVSPARVQPMYQPRFIATTESRIVEVRRTSVRAGLQPGSSTPPQPSPAASTPPPSTHSAQNTQDKE